MSRSRFRPPWWATLGTALLGALFVAAGIWQLGRAEERRVLLANFDRGVGGAPLPAPSPGVDTALPRYRSIVARGRYDTGHQILLDARTRDGRAGYEVLTPLHTATSTILVNRGWLPADPDRSRLPDVAVGGEERTVRGLLDRLPRAALATRSEPATDWPRRLLYPQAADIGVALGYPVPDYQLLLAPDEPDGLRRDWRPATMTPAQHLGYAVQWFALAVALGVIYVALNWRKPAAEPDDS